MKLNREEELQAELTSIKLKDIQEIQEDSETSEINENNSGIVCISSSIGSVGFNLVNMSCWKYG